MLISAIIIMMTSHELGGTQSDSPLEQNEGLIHVDDDYDNVDLPEWFVEPGSEHGYRPWQHTPLTPYDEPVKQHQLALYNAFQRLALQPIPPDTDEGIAHLVHLDFMAGNAHRQAQSQSNFEHWKQNYPEEYEAVHANDELFWLLGEAKTGHANPASLLKILAAAPSLRSLDLQVLTTPFGYRRHNLPAMRAELVETVESIGGELLDAPLKTHVPKIAVHVLTDHEERDCGERGLIVTQKQLIGGYMHDEGADPIFIMERQAYVVRTDEASGFSNQILELLRTTPAKDPSFAKVREYVMDRIETNTGVIPTSTMVYAYRMHEDKKSEPAHIPAIVDARREAALGQAAIK